MAACSSHYRLTWTIKDKLKGEAQPAAVQASRATNCSLAEITLETDQSLIVPWPIAWLNFGPRLHSVPVPDSLERRSAFHWIALTTYDRTVRAQILLCVANDSDNMLPKRDCTLRRCFNCSQYFAAVSRPKSVDFWVNSKLTIGDEKIREDPAKESLSRNPLLH